MKTQEKKIQYLNELSDYKISSGYSDVRGWEVKDTGHRIIGKVDNLLVNKNTERVVYLDIEVDNSIIEAGHDPYGRPSNIDVREFVNSEGENHIILPIGLVDIDDENDYVFTDSIDHRTFAETKRIRRGAPIDRAYETIVMDSYQRKHNLTADDEVDPDLDGEAIARKNRLDSVEDPYNTDRSRSRQTHSDSVEDENDLIDKEIANEKVRHDPDHRKDDAFYDRREFDDRRFHRRGDDS